MSWCESEPLALIEQSCSVWSHCSRVPALLDHVQRLLCLAGVVRLCRAMEEAENYHSFAAEETETFSKRSWQSCQCSRQRPGMGEWDADEGVISGRLCRTAAEVSAACCQPHRGLICYNCCFVGCSYLL